MVNPYRTPVADDSLPLQWLGGPSRSKLVAQGLLYRKVAVEAPVEATVEFHGRSMHDRVLLNGQVVAQRVSWWRITPRLEFVVATDAGPCQGRVELRVWPWLALRRFRVIIANHVVYAEP